MDVFNERSWAENSGLMPMRLNPNEGLRRYIMLDGGIYDFCLDFSEQQEDIMLYKSRAWSSNSKNYIHVNGDEVLIYNWLNEAPDKLPKGIVQSKFGQFIKILNNSSYKTSEDVAPFVLDLFRKMRNQTSEKKEPIEALNLLYCLLVSLEEDTFTSETFNKWSINSNVILPDYFESLTSLMKRGCRNIIPNLDLILRHGSGVLFQEAHRVAQEFDRQLSLFDSGFSSNIVLKPEEAYSSVHYTPQYLARSIVEKSISELDLSKPIIRILDPACGSGTFLVEALKQLKEKSYCGRVEVFGWDCSACAVSTTRFLLKYEQRTQWTERTLEINLNQVEDSLLESWDGGFDLILMNPPFLSMELIKSDSGKDAVNDALQDLGMRKRPNQSAAFFYKAVGALSPNGILGTILPSSILLFAQYDNLRDAVSHMTELQVVGRLGNYIFENALTDVSFIILKKKDPRIIQPQTIWCKNQEQVAEDALREWRKMEYCNTLSSIKPEYNIYFPTRFPIVQSSWKTIPQSDDYFINQLDNQLALGKLVELSSIFDIRQGALRGNKDAFVANQSTLDSLSDSEKRLFRPLASAETICDGQVKTSQYLWFPYNKDGLMITTEDQLSQYPNVYKWLLQWKNKLEKREGINKWWELTRPRNWQYVPYSKLVSKRFGTSSSFAITKDDEVVEEGNAFLLKSMYVTDDRFFYLSLFSSDLFNRLLSIYARPLLMGYDLGKVQIKNIPVPDAADIKKNEPSIYGFMVEYGRKYAEGNIFIKDKIDEIVKQFYPIP